MKWQPGMAPVFLDFDRVIDARVAFADKRHRDDAQRDFAALVGMAFAAPANAMAWTLVLCSLFWAV